MEAIGKYYIKEGYRENPTATTVDTISGGKYWNNGRIGTSLYYQFHVYEFARNLIQQHNLSRIVDVGCGFATKLAYLNRQIPNLDIIGIDQAHPIEFCRERYDFGKWLVDDFENPSQLEAIPHPDLVICADVIEHVLNPDILLDYIKALSKGGGYIIMSTPDRDALRGVDCMHSPHPQHIREWSKEEFLKYMESHGFAIDEHKSIYPFKLGANTRIIRQYMRQVIRGVPKKNGQLMLMHMPRE